MKRIKYYLFDAAIERRATAMHTQWILQSHVNALEDEYRKRIDEARKNIEEVTKLEEEVEERRKIAEAWKPYESIEQFTDGHRNAIANMSETQIEAVRIILQNLQRQISYRVAITDGPARDRALYSALGVRIALDAFMERRKIAEAKEEKEIKKKVTAAIKAQPQTPRTVFDIYQGTAA